MAFTTHWGTSVNRIPEVQEIRYGVERVELSKGSRTDGWLRCRRCKRDLNSWWSQCCPWLQQGELFKNGEV